MESSQRLVRLLDVEPELAARLREDDRAEARERLLLRVTDVPPGDWRLEAEGRHGRPFGLVVVEGLMLQQVGLGGRSALQLLGAGDLVLPELAAPSMLEADLRWTAAVPSRVAVLDDRLQLPFALWPGLAIGLVERAGRQLARTAVHNAISQLPRVDQRLEALFWDLAERWGHVTPSGIHIPLELSHEVLAQMVGGKRPTITLALADLADRSILVRRPDRTWLVVAEAPSLPRGGRPAAPALRAEEAPVSATLPEEASHWEPEARAELLASAGRMFEEHRLRRARLAQSLQRAAEVCETSQALRDRFAGHRGKKP
jgi:CRP-like cAMP-binding protein